MRSTLSPKKTKKIPPNRRNSFGSIINVVVSEKGITTFLNLWQKNKRFESPMNYNNSSKNKTTKGLNLKSLI
jgi:hypothetical protein